MPVALREEQLASVAGGGPWEQEGEAWEVITGAQVMSRHVDDSLAFMPRRWKGYC